jgi:eukaryotic-like serine/threonine-protein kinase
MPISNGTRLGSYEVLAPIGAGGMGEVYQAHDTKLGRDVAIKILPEAFAHDPERLSRFQREAKMLAALNHPNIATIHGLEHSDGTHFLIMELVSGENLADRIKREGAVPVEEALKIAVQIAEALEAAHEKGIIHRDLKPANVKVTPEGKVKVLDFGLAKAFAGDGESSDPSESPTLSRAATMQGVILGTAGYMSPEQARGKSVDKRTDIWAFGCVLYDMLTGKQAFDGEDITEILAAVVKTEPDWQALPAATPVKVRDLLRRCLQKDKTLRLRDAGDACIEIQEALSAPVPANPMNAVASKLGGWRLPALVSLAVLVVAGLVGSVAWTLKPAPAPPAVPVVARFTVALRPNEQIALGSGGLAISPDGTYIAYTSTPSGGTRQLFLRPMDRSEAIAIPGSDGATGPFFSPDGQWIAFTAGGKLNKAPLAGGTPIALCDKSNAGTGSWSADGTIFFPDTKLMRVSAAGGTPQAVTTPEVKPGESGPRWPEVLPGGQAILYVTGGTNRAFSDDANIIVLSLKTGQRKTLIQGGTSPHYLSTGHLVYAQGGRLLAVSFDLGRLELTGAAAPILEDVRQGTGGMSAYSLARDGSLVYVNGGEGGASQRVTLNWVDRKGTEQPLPAPPHVYLNPRLSPDGRQVALDIVEADKWDVWIYDLMRDTLTRLTFEGINGFPVWTPDGEKVAYMSQRTGPPNIYWTPTDGSGAEERLTTVGGTNQTPMSFSPDGRTLVYNQQDPKTGYDLWVLPLQGERKPQIFLQTPFNERSARLSPDGRWLAYVSDESGRYEVYVRPFPGPGGKWQISTEGAAEVTWSPRVNELFFRTGKQREKMMVVDIQTQPTFSAGKPRQLFEGPYANNAAAGAWGPDYSIAPDGRRFLMLKPKEQQQTALTQINVVLNWSEELKRRVPTGK